jgi:hypothetical protein
MKIMEQIAQKRYKSPVTIIVGIKCYEHGGEGIVITSDSRTTDAAGYCNDNAEKLHVVSFKDGNTVIVAEAGNADFSGLAIEQFENLAATEKLNDYRTAAECLGSAVARLKDKIREQQRSTCDELQKYLADRSFELMLAYYWDGKPIIFTLQLEDGLPVLRKNAYCAIGCGHVLADFIISRVDLSHGFGTGAGMWLGVYAVEEIKKLDTRCGGKTRGAVIEYKDGKSVSIISRDGPAMDEVIREALDFADAQKKEWTWVIESRINNVIKRRIASQQK